MIRVLVADDQTLVRAGFRMIIDAENDMEVVAEAEDGAEAVELSRRARPDVVLMDIRMPRMDGIEATKRLTAPAADAAPVTGTAPAADTAPTGAAPGADAAPTAGTTRGAEATPGADAAAGVGAAPRVVILTTYDLDEYVFDALTAGASGFLLKDVPPEDLVKAIRVAAKGEALLAPSITRRLIEQFARTRPVPPDLHSFEQLTEREVEVLRLVAQGLSNSEIAGSLYLGESTVKTHVGHILDKLGLRDRVQAVILAYDVGLVQPGRGG